MSSPEKSPTVVVSCQVLQDLLANLLPDGLAQQVTFMDYGLHQVPGQMAGALQEVLDGLEQPSLVVLGYGLCGTGLKGLKAGPHTLLVPRVDDCISLLLGSYRAYMREFQAVPGTYYLSKGWLESGSHPLKEYQEYVPRYGEKEAMWLMDQQYQHYERLVLVAQDRADLETYRAMRDVGLPLASNLGWALFAPPEPELKLFGGRHRIEDESGQQRSHRTQFPPGRWGRRPDGLPQVL